jgi:hypothetical protein
MHSRQPGARCFVRRSHSHPVLSLSVRRSIHCPGVVTAFVPLSIRPGVLNVASAPNIRRIRHHCAPSVSFSAVPSIQSRLMLLLALSTTTTCVRSSFWRLGIGACAQRSATAATGHWLLSGTPTATSTCGIRLVLTRQLSSGVCERQFSCSSDCATAAVSPQPRFPPHQRRRVAAATAAHSTLLLETANSSVSSSCFLSYSVSNNAASINHRSLSQFSASDSAASQPQQQLLFNTSGSAASVARISASVPALAASAQQHMQH